MPFDYGINNAIILSPHNGYEPFYGAVGVEDARIASVSEAALRPGDARVLLDATGKILMPGLVNGHCHGDMTLAKGMGDDMTLAEQNKAFSDTNWFYSLITDDDRYYSRLLTYAEALLSGTTFLMENMYWSLGGRSAEAMVRAGIRGALAEDVRRDFTRPDDFLPYERLERFGAVCAEAGLVPVLAGVSEEDFDPERLRRIYETAASLGFAQTCHLAETVWRADLVKKRFGTTPVRYLERCGVLHAGLIGSHAVYVSPEEARLMAARGVSVVSTPLCEMKIADGVSPVPAYMEAGVVVGLGTDGAMWNNSNDLFREMKCMSLLHTVSSGIRTLRTADILDMATVNGAKIFGLERSIGTIEAGKSADFILIDATGPHMTPLRTGARQNVASCAVFCAVGRDVTDVFVRGRQVVENRTLTTMDLRDVQDRVTQASLRIADAYGK